MGPLFSWTAIAVIVLPPTILLACIGLAFLASLVKYNLPVLPHGAHREHQENKVVEGRCRLPSSGGPIGINLALSDVHHGKT